MSAITASSSTSSPGINVYDKSKDRGNKNSNKCNQPDIAISLIATVLKAQKVPIFKKSSLSPFYLTKQSLAAGTRIGQVSYCMLGNLLQDLTALNMPELSEAVNKEHSRIPV